MPRPWRWAVEEFHETGSPPCRYRRDDPERGKVLLGKRKGSHGPGEYAFPGGHLEYRESFEACACREVREECGLEICNLRFQFLANVTAYAPKHYVHINLLADWRSSEPQVLEPEKCETWGWHALSDPPKPLFAMCRLAWQSYETGETYFDIQS